jgi:mannose-1-phosphate guanylyltransferase
MDLIDSANTWALVLAAGEGTRLRTLTTCASGASVPKQFCSLQAGPSLLEEALQRAHSVAYRRNVCTVVAAQHSHWWAPMLGAVPRANIMVQPMNRGTAHGILLPLLQIVERDPSARIVVLPSDHYVREETILAGAMRQAVMRVAANSAETVLLGLMPEYTDPELGYIVPGTLSDGVFQVRQFVEKPPMSIAHALIEHGGLWNAFIMAASAQALLTLFQRRMPTSVEDLRTALRTDQASADAAAGHALGGGALDKLYPQLPLADFSRDILMGQEAQLRVLPVPQCGWSDLGTPRRVGEVLKHAARASRPRATRPSLSGYLSLSAQFETLQFAASCAHTDSVSRRGAAV